MGQPVWKYGPSPFKCCAMRRCVVVAHAALHSDYNSSHIYELAQWIYPDVAEELKLRDGAQHVSERAFTGGG